MDVNAADHTTTARGITATDAELDGAESTRGVLDSQDATGPEDTSAVDQGTSAVTMASGVYVRDNVAAEAGTSQDVQSATDAVNHATRVHTTDSDAADTERDTAEVTSLDYQDADQDSSAASHGTLAAV